MCFLPRAGRAFRCFCRVFILAVSQQDAQEAIYSRAFKFSRLKRDGASEEREKNVNAERGVESIKACYICVHEGDEDKREKTTFR